MLERERQGPSDKVLLKEYLQHLKTNRSKADTAFAQLYQRHATLLQSIVNEKIKDAAESKDIVQRTFEKLLEHAERLLLSTETPQSLRPWLITVAKDLVRRKYIKRTELLLREDESVDDYRGSANTVFTGDSFVAPDEAVERRGDTEFMRRAIASISYPMYRKVLFLTAIRGYSYHEVEERCQLTQKQVNEGVSHGKKELREIIEVARLLKEHQQESPSQQIEHVRELSPRRLLMTIRTLPYERQRKFLRRRYIQQETPAHIAEKTAVKPHIVREVLLSGSIELIALLTLEPIRRSGELALLDEFKEQQPDLFEVAVNRIPSASERQAVMLFEIEGKSYPDIATEMSLTVDTVRTRLFAGRRTLIKILKGESIQQYSRPMADLEKQRSIHKGSVVEAIQRIHSERERMVTHLRVIEERTIPQIALQLQLRIPQVYNALERGVRFAAEALKENNQESLTLSAG